MSASDVPVSVERAARALLPRGSSVVLACSGGPDSQAMLAMLAKLATEHGWQLHAVGLDHGLRPEAHHELDLAETLATSLGISFRRETLELPTHGNVLANARKARYRALRRIAKDLGAQRIALGHTRSDQAETVLQRMVRGTGLRGAAAIPRQRGAIVRPLLGLSRYGVRRYLRSKGIPSAEDPTNSDRRTSRATLRHDVLPILKTLNPRVERSLARFAHRAAQDESLLTSLAQEHWQQRRGLLGSLSVRSFAEIPKALQHRVLRLWLEEADRSTQEHTLEVLLAGIQRGRLEGGPRGILLDRGYLWVEPAPSYCFHLTPADDEVPLPGLDSALRCRTSPRLPGTDPMPWSPNTVAFDRDRLHVGLRVRPWQHGDRLRPFGLGGRSKVGDIFTDAKIPRPLRAHWPVVVHGDDILWVAGLKRSNFAPVRAQSDRIVVIELDGALTERAW